MHTCLAVAQTGADLSYDLDDAHFMANPCGNCFFDSQYSRSRSVSSTACLISPHQSKALSQWAKHPARPRVGIPDAISRFGGGGRNRTGVHGFAGRCITTLPPRQGCADRMTSCKNPMLKALFALAQAALSDSLHFIDRLEKRWSGKRVSNSRPQPWQGCALPTELFPRDDQTVKYGVKRRFCQKNRGFTTMHQDLTQRFWSRVQPSFPGSIAPRR